LWERRNQLAQALPHAREALRLHQATGHQAGQADALNTVGWCYALLGEYQEALSSCQQALALHQILGDPDGLATTWDSLGYIHQHLGQPTQSVSCYESALTLFRDIGDRYSEAATLTRLGDTYDASGDAHAARHAWQQALAILDPLQLPDADKLRAKLARHSLDADQRAKRSTAVGRTDPSPPSQNIAYIETAAEPR
jgi:tetratricopeptide (TPR) repeat protein